MPQRKLFPPLPDFVPHDHRSLAWRVTRIEETLEEHLPQSKKDSPLPFILMVLTWGLGILGLVSPAFVAQVIRALLH